MDDGDRTIEMLRRSVERAEQDVDKPDGPSLGRVIHQGRRRRRGRNGVGLALAVVLVAGVGLPLYALLPLGESSRIPGGAPLSDAGQKVTSISPVADFMGGSGATSLVAFDRIEQPKIASCMHQDGWYYVAVVPTASRSATNPSAAIRYAELFGYGFLDTQPGNPVTDGKALAAKNGAYQRSLSATALSGYITSLTSCRTAADSASQKSFPMFNQPLSTEIRLDQERSRSDPSFVAAQVQWSQCMAQKGFSFATQDAARASFNVDIQSYTGSSSEQRRERQVAYADALCAYHTVWPVVFRLETAIVRAIVSKYGREATCGASC